MHGWWHTGISIFSPTASPELDQALDRFRQELFIPHSLPKRQRQSMFKQKHAHRLEEEPITVNISETEQYTLRPKRVFELPSKKDASEVLNLMYATKDFRNLVPFMSGLWMAKFKMPEATWEGLIRKTRDVGKLSLILECARQADHTGLRLRNLEIVQRLFFEFHRIAQEADFVGPQTTKALSMAKQAADIMDADLPDHAYRNQASNPKNQPLVLATLLELSAAHAVNEAGGRDVDKQVMGYLRKLIASLPSGRFQRNSPTEKFKRHEAAAWVREAITVYNGLQLSLPVHGVAADKRLHTEITTRIAEVKEALAKVLLDPSLQSLGTAPWALARTLLQVPKV